MPSRLGRALAVLLVADAIVLSGLLLYGTRVTTFDTIARSVLTFVTGQQQGDSWIPMDAAIAYLETPHERDVYDELLLHRGVKFQYPMSSLLFVRGVSPTGRIWLSQAAVVVTALAVWLVFRRSAAAAGLAVTPTDVGVALAIVGLTVTFYPVIKSYSLGQIQTWISALVAVAFALWVMGREKGAGVLVGVALLMKPVYWPLVVWGLLRRKWGFVAAVVVTVAIGGAITIWQFGARDTFAYADALNHMGARGEAFFPNQSINGLLNRWFENGSSLRFDRTAFPPFHPWVFGGTVAGFVLLSVFALVWPARKAAAGGVLDLGLMLLVLTITAPIAWIHHYGVLLPVFAALTPVLLTRRPLGSWTVPVLVVSYVVMSQVLAFTNWYAGALGGLAQSYHFFAALAMLVLLCLAITASGTDKST